MSEKDHSLMVRLGLRSHIDLPDKIQKKITVQGLTLNEDYSVLQGSATGLFGYILAADGRQSFYLFRPAKAQELEDVIEGDDPADEIAVLFTKVAEVLEIQHVTKVDRDLAIDIYLIEKARRAWKHANIDLDRADEEYDARKALSFLEPCNGEDILSLLQARASNLNNRLGQEMFEHITPEIVEDAFDRVAAFEDFIARTDQERAAVFQGYMAHLEKEMQHAWQGHDEIQGPEMG